MIYLEALDWNSWTGNTWKPWKLEALDWKSLGNWKPWKLEALDWKSLGNWKSLGLEQLEHLDWKHLEEPRKLEETGGAWTGRKWRSLGLEEAQDSGFAPEEAQDSGFGPEEAQDRGFFKTIHISFTDFIHLLQEYYWQSKFLDEGGNFHL